MKLTSRIKKMIHLLLEETNYITVQLIAENTNISSRTVIRELILVENWLNEKGILLEKKKGTGIRIQLGVAEREKLKESLMEEKADLIYEPEQRLVMLKAELLKKFELTKLYTLTRLFGVTEGTISADLDKLETWLEKYNLTLTRKPGLGIYIEGSEMSVRSAIISLIYEQFHEADLINLIINKEKSHAPMSMIQNKINQVILEFIDMSNIELGKKLLAYIEEHMGYQIADNSFVALIIRFSVTVKRCEQGIFISNNQEYQEPAKSEKIFSLVNKWFHMQESLPFNELPQEEIYYLAIHIKGAKLRETLSYNKISMTEDYKTIKLAKEIIYIAEKETGIYLEDNEKLLIGLVRHLRPAIYRMKMHLDIMNPLLEDIKQMYPKLFETTRKCAQVIEVKEHVNVPEDEIAYLATHIGAAIKSEKRNVRKIYRAVVACTNGIGASQLLVTEIEKEFPSIEIVEVISTIDMRALSLAEDDVDLIISTVPIANCDLPIVIVNTILGSQDKKRIKEVLENVLPEDIPDKKIKTIYFREKLKTLKLYSDLMLQVMDNFSFVERVSLEDVNELIQFVSTQVTTTSANRIELENAFIDREEKGSTILGKKGMMLLHCRSRAVNELYVMVVRLKGTILINNTRSELSEINTIIVMIAPLEITSHALEILSEITRKTITSDFAITLKQGTKEDVYMGISTILDNFIQNRVMITK
ncbi:BglG family transcription antiterminator [Cellulosilyticum sp. I15G10I2]|uniref:BglG family transcription antiterminator n=1 Tax=Cellulosilyticum sp. I15G10I2 TaxID=1892843 RepID=UPI00085C4DD7|nr:BglG family transcription antiterminator [Cellulosilyticum sp. I15G10I2]